ncbi:hypothetical protein HanIR_Chr04g0158361 [Helianthus annuus]|nr:hypothetical protein HanIR_Chr04g0158361 [Helianthus annuus]
MSKRPPPPLPSGGGVKTNTRERERERERRGERSGAEATVVPSSVAAAADRSTSGPVSRGSQVVFSVQLQVQCYRRPVTTVVAVHSNGLGSV